MKQFQKFNILFFVLICLLVAATGYSQTSTPDKKQGKSTAIQKEITASLEKWNEAAKSRNVRQLMELIDNSGDIIVVGSDSGEVFKGRDQIENWITKLFAYASFSWDMKRVDMDQNGNTAWVFMDGFMIVTNDKGKTSKFPYRFTGILVKVKNTWKWRLFDGSVPGGH
jgi:ketosteroid isomerase-like protein